MYTRDFIPKVLNMQQNISNECRMMSSTARIYLYIFLIDVAQSNYFSSGITQRSTELSPRYIGLLSIYQI